MNHQRLLWNMHCVATVVLRKQLKFKSAVLRSNRSSCLQCCTRKCYVLDAVFAFTFTPSHLKLITCNKQ